MLLVGTWEGHPAISFDTHNGEPGQSLRNR